MRLAIVKQCDISAGEFAACLDLSFHLCINLFSPGILLQKASYFPCCSWISSVICYSFWRPYLNGNGLTLTIHSCLHIFQSVLSSIFYLSLLSCTSRDPLLACSRTPSLLLLLLLLLPCTVSFVSEKPHECCCCCFYYYLHLCYLFLPSFVLYPPLHTSTVPDNTAICLVIHPSSNTFPTWRAHFSYPSFNRQLSFHLTSSLSHFFHLSLNHFFIIASLCHLALFSPLFFICLPLSLPPHPPPSHPPLYPIWLERLQQM